MSVVGKWELPCGAKIIINDDAYRDAPDESAIHAAREFRNAIASELARLEDESPGGAARALDEALKRVPGERWAQARGTFT